MRDSLRRYRAIRHAVTQGYPGQPTGMIARYLTTLAALNQLQAEGFEVKGEDVARLSPLLYKHIHFQGRYSFALSEAVAQGGLRPLRDPYDQDV